MKYQLKVSY